MPDHQLHVLGHADLAQRPDRTERAFRVFFPRQAADYLALLQRGGELLVREGSREDLAPLSATLSAQGFRCRLQAVPAEAGTR